MKTSDKYLISKFFSRNSMHLLADDNGYYQIQKMMKDHFPTPPSTLREGYELLYRKLLSDYRNEYIYK